MSSTVWCVITKGGKAISDKSFLLVKHVHPSRDTETKQWGLIGGPTGVQPNNYSAARYFLKRDSDLNCDITFFASFDDANCKHYYYTQHLTKELEIRFKTSKYSEFGWFSLPDLFTMDLRRDTNQFFFSNKPMLLNEVMS